MLTISGTSYQLSLYILILKLNSQIHIYKFSDLAASCIHPLMGYYGNHSIPLMELTEVKKNSFFFLFYSVCFERIPGLSKAGGPALYTAVCFN